MLSTSQFDRTRRLALSLAGIELVDRHRELLDRRSRRAGILDIAGMDSLLGAAESGEAAATQKLLCLLTTKFTGFYRHPHHFEIAAEHALRAVRQRGRARLWSAAAATGEEPYSLAMALLAAFGHDEPPVSILATDIDIEALATAQRGEFGDAAMRSLDPVRRGRFFTNARGNRRWAVAPEVRELVEFRTLNLAGVDWPVTGPFDVIFCRNVLMYLESSRRGTALERITSLLVPEGLLILDPAEHLGQADVLFVSRGGGLYHRRDSVHRPSPAP